MKRIDSFIIPPLINGLSILMCGVREVDVHQAGEAVRVFTINDTLDGGAVLPGFTLAVKDIFPPQKVD